MTGLSAAHQAANVLLDTVTAIDAEPGTDGYAPLDLAFQRMNEVGAVAVRGVDPDGSIRLDCTPLIGGAVLLLDRLIGMRSEQTGAPAEEVVSDLRALLADELGRSE